MFPDLDGPTQSSGISSFLRECLGDEEDWHDVSSDNGAGHSGINFADSNHLGTLNHLSESLQLGASYPVLPKSTVQAATTACGGQSFPLHVRSCGIASATACAGIVVGARKRGRKPKPRLPDLQQRLVGLYKEMQQLSKENIFLRNKLKVLERVVPYRDESANFLTQLLSSSAHTPHTLGPTALSHRQGALNVARPSHQSMGSPEPSRTALEGQATTSLGFVPTTAGEAGEVQSCHSHDGGGSASGARSCTSNAAAGIAVFAPLALGDFASGFTHMTSASQQKRDSGQERGEQQAEVAMSSGTSALLALCPGPDGEVPVITPAALEKLKRITAHEFRMLWKHICLQLGVLVTAAEVHGPGSSPHIRLERFLERALSYMDKITLLSPTCFVHSMYTNVETGQPERPPDSFWIACARALQLSPQQLHEVTSLAAVYEQNVVPVVQQRLQLAMQLSSHLVSVGTSSTLHQDSMGTGCGIGALPTLLSVDELAEQLERNVLKEHQTHWNIGDFLCSSVLKPLQIAKALSVAYPYIPDGVAMLHAFKLITAQDEARAAVAAASKPGQGTSAAASVLGHQAPSSQPFPMLAGLLASKLLALIGGLATNESGSALHTLGPVVAGVPQQRGSAGGAMAAAALVKLVAGLPPTQLQQAIAAFLQQPVHTLAAALQGQQQHGVQQQQQQQQQPVQVQAFVAGLQAAVQAFSVRGQPAVPIPWPRVLPEIVPLAVSTAVGGAIRAGMPTAAAGQER